MPCTRSPEVMMKTTAGYSAADPLRRPLEFEPVPEHQVVALRGVGPERLFLLGGGARLHVAHRHAQ